MSSRGAMTMRATISRVPDGLPADEYGQDEPVPVEAIGGDPIPCRVWSDTREEIVDEGKRAIVESIRAIFPHDADVRENDRLSVEDRLGATLFGGPIVIRSLARKGSSSSNPGNQKAILERHA